jgi:spore maturation protein CgeB
MEAIEQLGHKIVPIDTEPEDVRKKQSRLIYRAARKVFGPKDLANTNKRLIETVEKESFDIIWIDKGTLILPKVLKHIKETTKSLLVHYNTDDIMLKSHGFKNYIEAITIYDVHFTSNTFNVSELYELGARKVYFTENAYDDQMFSPVELSDEDKRRLGSDIFFIGHWEPKTEELICCLAKHGLPISVRGQNWHKARNKKLLRNVIKSGPVWEEEYVKALCSGKIGLGIISKWNRNQTAGRTFEIPACGTFLLTERTAAIQSLYREAVEAEFFSSSDELVEKAMYYLENEDKREEIARAGYKRCINSPYSWKPRVAEMLTRIKPLLQK